MSSDQSDSHGRANAAGSDQHSGDHATERNAELGKVSMPASGQGSPKLHSDGVSSVGEHGRVGGGDSAGGAYPNPHTGKEVRGESAGFEGGQSERAYYGGGKLAGEDAPSDGGTPIDKGTGGSG